MRHIMMKNDIVEETCVIEEMLMVEIDIEIHVIMMKRVIEAIFIIEIETKDEMHIGMLRKIVDGNQG